MSNGTAGWVDLTGIGVVTAGAVAAGRGGGHVFVGRSLSTQRRRLNLGVIGVGPEGGPAGAPEWFPDSAVPLPAGGRSSVGVAVTHPSGRRLYLGVQTDYPGLRQPWPIERRCLTVWSLDDAGRPVGAPRSYDAGNEKGSLQAVTLHPTLPLLYVSGWGDPRVFVHELDADGEPLRLRGSHRVGGVGKYDIAFSPAGDLMYLGTHPDTLDVVPMRSDGTPAGPARQFSALGKWGSPAPSYLMFHYTPQALYRRATMPTDAPVIMWPLDSSGHPVGDPVSDGVPAGRLAAVDGSGKRLWLCRNATYPDAYTAASRRCGTELVAVPLDPSGRPAGPPEQVGVRHGAEPRLMTVTADGDVTVLVTPVAAEGGNEVRGHRLRVTVGSVTPPPSGPFAVSVETAGRGTVVRNGVAVGVPTTFDLDPLLRDQAGDVLVFVAVGSAAAPPQTVTVSLEPLDDTGASPAGVLTDTVAGGRVGILLPGYGFAVPGTRPRRTRLLSAYAQEHLRRAEAVAVAAADRPRLLTVSSSHLIGRQGHRGQLRAEAATLAALGVNTVNAYSWPALDPADVNADLDAAGLNRRAVAVYHPLQGRPTHTAPRAYFDFHLRRHPNDVAAWAQGLAAGVPTANGGTPGDVVDIKLSDEPAWYFPSVADMLDDGQLAEFRAFLARNHVDAADDARPVTNAAGASLAQRRLYYWTTRFFAESAARGHRLVTDELAKAFSPGTSVDVNWNSWINAWYIPAPNQKVANNPDVSSRAGMGGFDWYTSARLGSHNLWSADWVPDDTAVLWSVRASALGTAAALGTRPFGGYVVGNMLTGHPAGASYKALSLVGRGGKAVDFYCFGPTRLVGDGWSDNPLAYPSIADAARVLARAEHLIHPGRPNRGSVAILTTGTSHLWNAGPQPTVYMWETIRLSIALIHAGYSIDLVDEQSIRDDIDPDRPGSWQYSALYLTGPNVESVALERIVAWVRGGGVLAVGPGAGVADEYDTASPLLEQVLGIGPRTAERTDGVGVPLFYDHTLRVPADPVFGTQELAVRGPGTPLVPVPGGAEVVASFASGAAAITRHRFGHGSAVAYGFYPGLQYVDTLDHPLGARTPRDRSSVVRGWEDTRRRLAVAPAVLAGAAKPAHLSHEPVEVCRLDSDRGTALVLLNWSAEPISELSVVLCEGRRWRNVHSARRVPVELSRSGNHLTVRMPLEHTDVLLLEHDPRPR
ncbi:hypothetical protein Val02_02560 [Virgisporangium aliadipatigenens]|uniref:Beta-galactosidase trimerisation domain-containing protein n=1 Tax=Virgisporangium aliadipatigenens TaxID=741659 RepID=A0A8J3YFZ9_9ACTN|nr:hypothetical protein [Virgisporangium aliadipatigenens]GIJ43370.1 hypothetical protein Val02_02560 [Virgisporangium aliadipatigenens]